MDTSKLNMSAEDKAALAKAVAVKAPGAGSMADIMPLKQIRTKNEALVTYAVQTIAKHHEMVWDGTFYTVDDQITVALTKGDKAALYKVWTVNRSPVIYYVMPVTAGAFETIGVDTQGKVAGKFSRKAPEAKAEVKQPAK